MLFTKRSLAVLALTFFGLSRAAPAQAAQQEPAKPADGGIPLPNVEKLLPPEQTKELRKALEQVEKLLQDLGKQLPVAVPGGMPGGFGPGAFGPGFPFGPGPNNNRLGAALKKPSAVLVEQLDLPNGQGLVLNEVRPGSAAAKAGLKANDILLQLGGKAVPSEVDDFVKTLNGFKTGAKVDAVVLRKGKKETVKGLTLPEAPQNNPAQFQFQFPGGAAPPIFPPQLPGIQGQLPGFGPALPNGFGPAAPAGQIALADGKAPPLPTAYSGAFRIRALPPGQPPQGQFAPPQPGETLIALDVAGEPRLRGFKIGGTPLIDKAIDDRGQRLTVALEPNNDPPNPPALPGRLMMRQLLLVDATESEGPQRTVVRLKRGAKPAKLLKELSGTIPVDVLLPAEPLITVDNVLKAAGQTVKGKNGGSIEVKSIEKLPTGDYRTQLVLERPADPNNQVMGPGGFRVIRRVQIQVNGNPVLFPGMGGADNEDRLPALVDARGKAFTLLAVPSSAMNFNGGATTQTVTLVYRPQEGQGDPARLVLNGQRRQIVQVPFTLRDVPLP